MMHPDLSSVRAEAANRRSALREAFMRHDPQLTGKVAPHRVREVILAQRIDIHEEAVAKFMHYGRFEWMNFCDALERELAAFLHKSSGQASSARSASPRQARAQPSMMKVPMGSALMSPRRLPALLRTADIRSPRAGGEPFMAGTLSPRALPGSMPGSVGLPSPREQMMQSSASMRSTSSARGGGGTPMGGGGYAGGYGGGHDSGAHQSPSMSPRDTLRPTAAMRAARLARVQALEADVMEKLSLMQSNRQSMHDVQTRPHLLTRVAKNLPVASKPEAAPPAESRLYAAMERMEHERLPSPRVTGANRGQGGSGRASPRRAGGASSPRGHEMSSSMLGGGGMGMGGSAMSDAAAEAPERRKPKATNRTVQLMQDKLAQQFTDIKKAFKYVDLDGNGRVTQKEIERALHMWNIPIDSDQIRELMETCDQDADGGVSYDEFVDALARDTVAPDAMGKRGMLSKDAMGEDAYAMLNEQLGHKKIKNYKMETFEDTKTQMTREEISAMMEQDGKKAELKSVKDSAMNAVNSRFGNMRKAFQYLDLDGNGKVDASEVKRALHMWGVAHDEEKLAMLMVELDPDGDGIVSYNEFVDHLARDTVAPAAMGKRGMLSKDAMGEDAYAMLNEQLGHKKIKNYKMETFSEEPEKPVTKIKPEMTREEKNRFKGQAVDAVASRFSNIRKAFQSADVDNSGKIGRTEIKRALHMWGVPHDEDKLDMLMAEMDEDGDGQVSYDEFVDHLARDTVAPAAMGKRGMLSKDAMGEDAYAMLNEQLGHKKIKNYKMESFSEEPASKGAASRIKPGMSREEQLKLFNKDERSKIKGSATDAVASRFSNIRKAFQSVDVDNSGKIGRAEIKRALHMWGVPHDEEKLDMLMIEMDEDGDGQVSYDEFVDHLARDTVAPAAMGKRGMLSKDAMGEDAYAMLNEQLGHKKIKNYKMETFE